MSFARVYPEYVAKAEKKGRTKVEVDQIVCWLTGYSQEELETQLEKQTDIETFLAQAPQLNPARALIKGVVCGVRVEDIEEPTMQGIRYLDKLVDELAKGKAMEKILRKWFIFTHIEQMSRCEPGMPAARILQVRTAELTLIKKFLEWDVPAQHIS